MRCNVSIRERLLFLSMLLLPSRIRDMYPCIAFLWYDTCFFSKFLHRRVIPVVFSECLRSTSPPLKMLSLSFFLERMECLHFFLCSLQGSSEWYNITLFGRILCLYGHHIFSYKPCRCSFLTSKMLVVVSTFLGWMFKLRISSYVQSNILNVATSTAIAKVFWDMIFIIAGSSQPHIFWSLQKYPFVNIALVKVAEYARFSSVPRYL